jgi:hypothetical protein
LDLVIRNLSLILHDTHTEILAYREMSSSLTARGVDACRAIEALRESEYGIGVSNGAAKQLKQP